MGKNAKKYLFLAFLGKLPIGKKFQKWLLFGLCKQKVVKTEVTFLNSKKQNCPFSNFYSPVVPFSLQRFIALILILKTLHL